MPNRNFLKIPGLFIAVSIACANLAEAAYRYDTNGATAGFGAAWSTASATPELWDINTTAAWTTSSTGETATGTWQGVTGLDGSTTVMVDDDLVLTSPTNNARIGFGDASVSEFIVDFGAHDFISDGLSIRIQSVQSPLAGRNGVFRFGGGNVGGSGGLVLANAGLSGSFTKVGSGALDLGGGIDGAGLTEITISEGTLKTSSAAFTSGTSVYADTGTNFQLAGDITVGKLEGDGSVVMAGIATSVNTLTVDASVSHTFGGSTNPGTRTLNIVKDGAAGFTMSSTSLEHIGTTIVREGLLSITGTHTGGGAYTVEDGGTLGGTGSIILADANVTVEVGGKLAPGTSAGELTFALGSGVMDLSAVSPGSLLFELGDPLTPTASDKITLTTGTLDIGVLNFAEFDFTNLSGFDEGTYTLFQTDNAIVGSIGTASGLMGSYSGTLSFGDSNTDLLLTVVPVPEPSTVAMFGLAVAGLLGRRRRH